jgi:hypothetical protein
MRAAVALAVAITLLAALGATGALASPNALGACVANGESWHLGAKGGSTYAVLVKGSTTCAFARTWVRRLTGSAVSRPGTVLHGPSGWHCIATLPVAGKALFGACAHGRGTGFSWVPKAP